MSGQELDIIDVTPAPAPMNLFGAGNPEDVVARASETATALTAVIQERKLFKDISGKSHVLVDGWTLLGSMLGVFPVVIWTRRLENPDGWEARVEARTLAGQVVGAAEAECLRSETMWAKRDDYALRGMAQTRATSRALRGPLGFIVHLAGFAATPAEEMPQDAPAEPEPRAPASVEDTRKALFALCNEFDKDPETMRGDGAKWADWVKAEAQERYGVTTRKALEKDQLLSLMQALKKAAEKEKEGNPFEQPAEV